MDFEQARSVAWWHKPWWWGGHGTWWVAPWGMADRDGWLMAVGAKQWLRDRHPLYRPQEDAPLYCVTRTGFPQWCDVDEGTIARVVAMTPVGDWPSGVPPPLDRPP